MPLWALVSGRPFAEIVFDIFRRRCYTKRHRGFDGEAPFCCGKRGTQLLEVSCVGKRVSTTPEPSGKEPERLASVSTPQQVKPQGGTVQNFAPLGRVPKGVLYFGGKQNGRKQEPVYL